MPAGPERATTACHHRRWTPTVPGAGRASPLPPAGMEAAAAEAAEPEDDLAEAPPRETPAALAPAEAGQSLQHRLARLGALEDDGAQEGGEKAAHQAVATQ